MKKNLLNLLFLGLIVSISFISCKKDENNNTPTGPPTVNVEQKQRALMLDFTATWCTYCGPAIPYFQEAAEEQKDNCVAIAVHTANSELTPYYRIENDDVAYRPDTWTLFKNSTGLNITGVPTFTVNQEKIKNTSNDFLRQKLVDKVNTYSSSDPSVDVGLALVRQASGVKIYTKTEFFKDVSGDYYLALYLLEDGIVHRQNVGGTYDTEFEHSHTLRAVLGNGTPDQQKVHGELITSGSIAEGETFENEITYTWDASLFELPSSLKDLEPWDSWDPNNYTIAAIIWKKSGGIYKFENGLMLDL